MKPEEPEVIREEIAAPVRDVLNDRIGALIKGMLKRGDRQNDIAACFGINSGRVSETNKGQRFVGVKAALPHELPPPGPYPTPYELWMFPKPWTIEFVGYDECLVCDATGRKLFYVSGDEGDGDEAPPSVLFHGDDAETEALFREIKRVMS